MALLEKILAPLAWLYGLGVGVRNGMFRRGCLRERSFPMPVIAVGNLAVGGTGKTPHVEYLLRLLSGVPAAMVSRGYGRATHGFRWVDAHTPAIEGGDEPVQVARKFPAVRVAVDANRCEAIEMLLQSGCDPRTAIVLDDAFQHRYVKAGLNILLTDSRRLFTRDRLLPAGRLREPAENMCRAHVIIVTKCAPGLTEEEAAAIRAEIAPRPAQRLFFTMMDYGKPYAYAPTVRSRPMQLDADTDVVMLTGIARPEPLVEHVRQRARSVTHIAFPDHHRFQADDAVRINKACARSGYRCMVLTTEKDAVRVSQLRGLRDEVLDALYVQPIEVRFLFKEGRIFNQIIKDYVRQNQRNSAVDTGPHAT